MRNWSARKARRRRGGRKPLRPPHCPNPACEEFLHEGPWSAYQRAGFYRTRKGRVRRLQCLRCLQTFSERAHTLSYWLKRPELICPVAAGIVAGSAHRQIARSLRCAPSTVTRLSARLGRHAMLLHFGSVSRLGGRLAEAIGHDDFHGFEGSQDCPFRVATSVGVESWFIYSLSPSVHRRAGRVSPHQRARLASVLPRRYQDDDLRSMMRSLDVLLPLVPAGSKLVLRADDNPAYRLGVRAHRLAERIQLEIFPNPERGPKGSPRSPEARVRDAAMFSLDLLHGLFRHSLAHFRRETIAFPRRLNAAMERLALTVVWRNFVKGRSERRTGSETPAMQIGLTNRRWRWREVFRRRLFFGRHRLPDPWPELYRREWTTPALRSNTVHALRYAF